jgi:hypothetical protein
MGQDSQKNSQNKFSLAGSFFLVGFFFMLVDLPLFILWLIEFFFGEGGILMVIVQALFSWTGLILFYGILFVKTHSIRLLSPKKMFGGALAQIFPWFSLTITIIVFIIITNFMPAASRIPGAGKTAGAAVK